MYRKGYNKYLYILITISFAASILCISTLSYESVFAQKNDKDDDDKKDDKDKLIVKVSIDLENVDIENTKFIRVIGFINGEEANQDIPISSIDKSDDDNLDVELKVNEENEIVEADTPDEFFVCGYQVGKGDVSKESTTTTTTTTPITKFDCNEGDILGNPTKISLFKSDSQVYSKSQEFYQANLNTVNNDTTNSDTVKIKILAPLADKKDTEKLVIAAMIKGQIQSEVIEDVQTELDKSDSNTISRTFTFDRNTDIGKIQIGERYHACVASNDLSPPEGQECEKRLVKNFDNVNSLPAR
ncbi:MAG: hypothetical protein QOK89_07830 [Nitrososphaeraceae archaeon]|nr:hypothetical protein [Nitrososphaeraceae archaeon]